MADFNAGIIEEFRSNQGKVGGMFVGMKLLLMTTRGAKTGKESIIPVVYTKDADQFVVVASKGGAPTNPSWYSPRREMNPRHNGGNDSRIGRIEAWRRRPNENRACRQRIGRSRPGPSRIP